MTKLKAPDIKEVTDYTIGIFLIKLIADEIPLPIKFIAFDTNSTPLSMKPFVLLPVFVTTFFVLLATLLTP